MGDSVGHWEGDTLVVDTVGVKVDRFTSVDRFGTPQSEAMHVVERYRMIDGKAAVADIDKYEKSEGGFNVGIDIKNQSDLIQMGKFVERKEAKSLNRYSDGRVWYWSKIKLI